MSSRALGTSKPAKSSGPAASSASAKLPAAPIRRVAEELQQARPFRSTAQEALLAVLVTADRIAAHLDRVLVAEADITRQQYNVLRILRGAGAEGLPTLVIAERMIERTPGVTRLLDRLESKGWIERERSAEDRREVRVRVSRAGLAVLARLDDVVDAVDDRPERELADGELAELVRLLDRLRALYP
ncbi:MAG: MarR family transcriptional regulator [Planctomycetes bacterium]|nr:MarR family transcriptional regulator [Planctomycetota bacterium]